MKSDWIIDTKAGTATHRATGLVLSSRGGRDDGSHSFEAVTIPKSLPLDAVALARLAREGGEAFMEAMRIDPELLAAAGRARFGEQWRGPMARALGRLHPEGPRGSIDPRLVRRWADGDPDRPIPAWVRPALRRLLEENLVEIGAVLKAL